MDRGAAGRATLPAMRRAAVLLSMSLAGLGCAGSAPPRGAEGPGLAVALAEARRSEGVAALAAIEAPAAVRGLGRVGDAAAIDRLLALLAEPASRAEAIAALGLAGSLGADVARAEGSLLSLWPGVSDPRLAVALGRIGTAAAIPVLTDMLGETRSPALREAAALALGVLGRRGVAIDAAAREELVRAAGAEPPGAVQAAGASADGGAGRGAGRAELRGAESGAGARGAGGQEAEVRAGLVRAAAYGLAHAPEAASGEEALALVRLAGHEDAEVRLWAQVGLQRRKVAAEAARPRFEAALADADVWVRVAGVRGLARLGDPPALARLLALIDAETGPVHPVLEALSLVAARPEAPAPAATLAELHARAELRLARAEPADRVVRARIACQLAALAARGPEFRPPLRCAEAAGPAADLERMFAETGLLGQGAGAEAARAARLAELAAHVDPRVRAAAVAAVARAWGAGAEGALAHALTDRSPAVAGAAAEALQARFTAAERPAPPGSGLFAALVRRASDERDSELFAALAAALAAIDDPAGLPACQPALRRAGPGVRAAARACVKALTDAEPAEPADVEVAPLPPVDPASVLGREVTWRLTTSRGVVEVALDPEVAPWHVAALVELTRRGFYDGLDVHRVVPGFVVQGGDPEGTGWGGPGFSLPSEPGEGRFSRGAVGIADAGKDTGGSQFFVMHARAPHLEGRYTRVGEVVGGMATVDALVVGDAIVRAEVTLR